MIDRIKLRNDIERLLVNSELEHQLMVMSYIADKFEKEYGKIRYDLDLTINAEGSIVVDIVSERKRHAAPLIITQEKVERHDKIYYQLDDK